jgi:hypothetical protein
MVTRAVSDSEIASSLPIELLVKIVVTSLTTVDGNANNIDLCKTIIAITLSSSLC